MSNKRRCFVLGAGFSKACGLPLASELTDEILEYKMIPERPSDSPSFRDHFERLVSYLPKSPDFGNFELLLTLIEELIAFRKDFGHAAGNAVDAIAKSWGRIRDNALRRLCLILNEKSRAPYNDGATATDRFVSSLHPDADCIVSFNWDTVIECACKRRNVAVAREPGQPRSLMLIKPHGSIDLAEIPDDTYDANHVQIRRLQPLHNENGVSTCCARDPADAAHHTIFPFNALIVPPTARKSYQSPWIKRQWHHAFNFLRAADEITVIGYSLPDFDFRPSILFRLAGLNRSKMPVRVFDLDPEPIKRKLSLAGYENVACVSGPWDNQCAEIVRRNSQSQVLVREATERLETVHDKIDSRDLRKRHISAARSPDGSWRERRCSASSGRNARRRGDTIGILWNLDQGRGGRL